MAEMFLPVFNGLARKNLSIPYLDSWRTVLVFCVLQELRGWLRAVIQLLYYPIFTL